MVMPGWPGMGICSVRGQIGEGAVDGVKLHPNAVEQTAPRGFCAADGDEQFTCLQIGANQGGVAIEFEYRAIAPGNFAIQRRHHAHHEAGKNTARQKVCVMDLELEQGGFFKKRGFWRPFFGQ